MPKTPIDYSKAIIYSIVCKTDETLIYIGSTTEFTKRKCSHKSDCNNEKSKKHSYPAYVMIRANGGWDNFAIKPLKEFPCTNKIQLIIEEERIRLEFQANLNTYRAYIKTEERTEVLKDYKENRRKNYDLYNEKRTEDRRKLTKEDKEKQNEAKRKWREANKDKLKEQYQANKEKINEGQRKWREARKQKQLKTIS